MIAKIRGVLDARGEVLEAYLFGSRARGRPRRNSDVDVAVLLAEAADTTATWGERAELTTLLMSALGTNAVDVVILNRAPPLLYHRVLRDGVRLLARDPMQTVSREAHALSRYFDYLPQLAKIEAARAGRERGDA